MTANLLTLNPSKTELMLIVLPRQLSKLSNPFYFPFLLPLIFYHVYVLAILDLSYSSLAFVKQMFKLSSTCHYHIRDLHSIRHTLDFNTASTIATSLVNCRLDYCNSFYYSLPSSQLHCLQSIQNALARAASRRAYLSSRSHHFKSVITSLAQDRTTYYSK